jgi:hypothetical protein
MNIGRIYDRVTEFFGGDADDPNDGFADVVTNFDIDDDVVDVMNRLVGPMNAVALAVPAARPYIGLYGVLVRVVNAVNKEDKEEESGQ